MPKLKLPARRRVGYIRLILRKGTKKEGYDGWYVLDVERIDPYGGKPFRQEYVNQELDHLLFWFNAINGNEDIFALHRESDLDPIADMPGTTNV